ncbi:MAG: hypothetical protein COB53_10670, partial [Elusimicrobia bacterium]
MHLGDLPQHHDGRPAKPTSGLFARFAIRSAFALLGVSFLLPAHAGRQAGSTFVSQPSDVNSGGVTSTGSTFNNSGSITDSGFSSPSGSSFKSASGSEASLPQPAKITNLIVTAVGPTTVTLNWSSPVADLEKGTGTVTGFLVRYSAAGPIATDTAFSTAANFSNVAGGLDPGATVTLIVDGLSNNQSYWFAVEAYNNLAVRGEVSNTVEGITGIPSPVSPRNGTGVSTTKPVLAWNNPISSETIVQLATDDAFTAVVADSTTLNEFYISTNVLTHATTYYWRARSSGREPPNWSETDSFHVDTVQPLFSAVEISTDNAGSWEDIATTEYRSSSTVSVRMNVQDAVSGLRVTTGIVTGLLGHWHFDQKQGEMILDASTGAHHGNLNSGSSWADGIRGAALSMTGNHDGIPVSNDSYFKTQNGFTVTAWIKTTNAGSAIILSNRNGLGVGFNFGKDAAGDELELTCDDGLSDTKIGGFTAMDDNQWHFVAGICGPGGMELFIDGVSEMTDPTVITSLASADNLFIGASPDGGADWDGLLDEVRFWDTVLTPTEIRELYQSDSLTARLYESAFHVAYSTTGGQTWTQISTTQVTMTGSNQDKTQQVMQVNDLELVSSTFTEQNQIALFFSDFAGNVSTTVYTVQVGTSNKIWDGEGADNNWYSGINWNPNGVPDASNIVSIGPNGDAAVVVDASSPSITFFSLELGVSGGGTNISLTLSTTTVGGAVTLYDDTSLISDTTMQHVIMGDLIMMTGSTITHSDNTTVPASANLNATVSGDFNFNTGAFILLDAAGYTGGPASAGCSQRDGNGPGAGVGTGTGFSDTGGAAHGGNGGYGENTALGGTAYDSLINPTDLGSGGAGGTGSCANGGKGGDGGGALLLSVSGTLTVDGNITANGENGQSNTGSGGGGSGGTLNLTAGTFTGTGSLSANGGGSAGSGGAGGGGRIAVTATSGYSFTGDLLTNPGTSGRDGGFGTSYLKKAGDSNFTILIGTDSLTPGAETPLNLADLSNADQLRVVGASVPIVGLAPTLISSVTAESAIITFDAGSDITMSTAVFALGANTLNIGTLTFTNGSIDVEKGASLTLTASKLEIPNSLNLEGRLDIGQQTSTMTIIGDIVLLAGSTMSHVDNGATKTSVLMMNVTGDFNVNTDAFLLLDSRGYTGGVASASCSKRDGDGPGGGVGTTTGFSDAGGGAYGGDGGDGENTAVGGTAYDTAGNPTDLGSGGAGGTGSCASGAKGGDGGGALWLNVSGTLTVNGDLTAQGETGTGGTGTGGTASGIGRFFKKKNSKTKIIGVDPLGSVHY